MTSETLVMDPAEHAKKAKKATGVAILGTLIEYYDFSVYGYIAVILAAEFFPKGDSAAALLDTIAVFGLAFLARPVGAWFFGRLGDMRGRRIALVATITLMGAAATMLGVLPTYAQIGFVAPLLLVVARILQGFSAGGEIGGAAAYIREWAPPNRRSFYISFIPSFANIGKGMAAGMAALVAATLSAEQLQSWGWRIPFLLAAPLALVIIWLRLRIEDSPEFAELAQKGGAKKSPLMEVFRRHPAALTKVVVISAVQNIGTYVGTVFIAVYFSEILGFSKAEASTIVLFAVLFAALLIPVAGLLGSRIGGRNTLLLSYGAYLVLTIPEFILMQQGQFSLALIGLLIGILPYALCQAGTYATMPELYPTEVRHTGISFGHSTGAVIGGGLSPYLVIWLTQATDNNMIPAFYLMASGLVGLLVVALWVKKNHNGTHEYR